MLCAGTVAAAVFNANPFREKGSQLISPLDFIPAARPPVEEKRDQRQSLEDQIRILTSAFGCGPEKPARIN
jgi:hypothetical protein